MDSLNKTRSLFYIKVHEAKEVLIKDIDPVNRVHLTALIISFNRTVCLPIEFCRVNKSVIGWSWFHRVRVIYFQTPFHQIFLIIGPIDQSPLYKDT